MNAKATVAPGHGRATAAPGHDRAAVACGHEATAEAAREILADGGNAFDAALAAM
jgi:gamma-glutamyltranspeptidase